MSIDLYRERMIGKLEEAKLLHLQELLRERFTQSFTTKEGTYVPHVSAEQVGLSVIEKNAKIRAYDDAIGIVNGAFREMMSPEKSPEESGAKPAEKKELY